MSQPLLHNRTAVITGAAQGIGYAIAETFIAEGARVVLGDLDADTVKQAAERLGGPDKAIGVRCNVTESADVDALLQAALDTYDSLDIMVNNAGITRDATMRTMTEEQFDQVIS